MKKFFKPEMFEGKIPWDLSCRQVRERFCDIANEIVETWPVVILRDNGPYPLPNKWVIDDGGFDMSKFTKKARLAFIEEIKKEPCKHEPREVFWSQEREYHHYDCKHCGVELKATWIEVKK